MAVLMILIDGIENDEYAACRSLRGVAPAGAWNNTPVGMETDSLNCIMTILGVAPARIPSGRAYLEALALALPVEAGDLVFRCNHVDVDENGVLVSSCKAGKAGAVQNGEYELVHIDKHKYLLIVKNGARYVAGVRTHPPHQNAGRRLADILPEAPEPLRGTLLRLIAERAIFPWGQAVKQETPTFYGLHAEKGAMVAKTEIVAGMAKALGMTCPTLENATADVDTDLCEKARCALEMCENHGFVMLHVNGADESAHRRDKAEKLDFIREIDEKVITFVLKTAPASLGVMVTADHETSSGTGRHVNSAVSYYCLNNMEECAKWLKRS